MSASESVQRAFLDRVHYANPLRPSPRFDLSGIVGRGVPVGYPSGSISSSTSGHRDPCSLRSGHTLGWNLCHNASQIRCRLCLARFFSGTFVTATASILQRLLPRLKFAQYASAAGVVVCLCNICIGPLAGFVLDLRHQDYHSMFLLSSALSWLALLVTFILYRAYVARGGDKHYVPPEGS